MSPHWRCCCEGGCWYRAITCPGDPGEDAIIYVPCEELGEGAVGKAVEFEGVCYWVIDQLSQLPGGAEETTGVEIFDGGCAECIPEPPMTECVFPPSLVCDVTSFMVVMPGLFISRDPASGDTCEYQVEPWPQVLVYNDGQDFLPNVDCGWEGTDVPLWGVVPVTEPPPNYTPSGGAGCILQSEPNEPFGGRSPIRVSCRVLGIDGMTHPNPGVPHYWMTYTINMWNGVSSNQICTHWVKAEPIREVTDPCLDGTYNFVGWSADDASETIQVVFDDETAVIT